MNYPILVVGYIVSVIVTVDGFHNNASSQHSLLNGETFDFIVVGAGTAGCAIAGRLAESGKHTVLLISEGGLPHPDFEVPALSTNVSLFRHPTYSKYYQSVRQLNGKLAENGTINYIISKSLGGASAINGMWLNRGNPQDYDNWAKLTGDESWNYSNLLKYFRKYENYVGDNPSDQRGFHGPITVSRPNYAPVLPQWLQAGRELGYTVGDPNGPQTEGFSAIEFSRKRGRRVSSYIGYIEPLLKANAQNQSNHSSRGNLVILMNTVANRVLFEGNRAVGVKFTSNSTGQLVTGYAKARKEIVISAGVMDSPTILMRSGIGPKSVLEEAKVPIVKELPVGRNLQDHIMLSMVVVLGNRSVVFDPERDLTPETWTLYQETGDGPYTSNLGTAGQAFVTSSLAKPSKGELAWPDLQLIYYSQTTAARFLSPFLPTVSDLREWESSVLFSTVMVRPKSRGTVILDPRNIDSQPFIDFQYLSHPDDMRVVTDGLKIMLRICEETSAFRQIRCRVPTTPAPGCTHLEFRSNPYWECYARQMASTEIHTAGTCRMGRDFGDPEAVVDTQLRVIGIKGLRVADTSVMPTIVNSNTQGGAYVIAEKAADMILKTWDDRSSLSSYDRTGLDWLPKHVPGDDDIWSLLQSNKFDIKRIDRHFGL